MVHVLDYGVSNLNSVCKAITYCGYDVSLARTAADVSEAKVLIMPGQGAFSQAIAQLEAEHLVMPIRSHIETNKPFLGICLGFQILFEGSDEHGRHEGLGVFPGWVSQMDADHVKVPHMGWNKISVTSGTDSLLKESYMYFVHSFWVKETRPNLVAATSEYGHKFVSAVAQDRVWATQFHPEKSGNVGMAFLRSFLDMAHA